MNKRILILLLVSLSCCFGAYGQNQGIGVHFGADDFYGPQTGTYFFEQKNRVNYNDNNINDTSKHSVLLWSPLIKFTYWFQLSRHFDINLGLSLADLQYPNKVSGMDRDSAYIRRQLYDEGERSDKFLGELDLRVNYNILPRNAYLISPYIYAGFSGSYHSVYAGANVPVGIGANIRLDKGVYLNLESGYRVAVTDKDVNHLQHTIGFTYWFKPGYKERTHIDTLVEVLPPPDMDRDGVTDSLDKCPTIPGLAQFNGCPDSDNDGIPDNEDQCPLVAGTARFNGCPDTDGDGISDNKDQCPYVAGTAENNGCPPPDADKDGIPDNLDKCPNEAGPASNDGCPEIKREVIELVEKAARSVFFETGKATLKKASYNSLNQIAKVMNADASLYIDIAGHTDNTGNADKNMELSDKRANACRDYLVSQGISADRMTAKGFGDTHPIADNKTAVGRAQNRRTEFKLRNYKQ